MDDIVALAGIWELDTPALISDAPSSRVYRASKHGKTVIVKALKPAGIDEIPGIDFLKWRDGKGAVRVLAQYDNAYLLEDGGEHTLRKYYDHRGDQEALGDIRGVVRHHLHAQGPFPHPPTLVPLDRHFRALFNAPVRGIHQGHSALIEWAKHLARQLLANQTYVRPLHGDIHHGNLVSFKADCGWKAIDPKGLIGDPAYDFANIFGNPVDEPDEILDPERCSWLADELCWRPYFGSDFYEYHRDVTALKLLQYAAVHSVLSACWSLEGDPSVQDMQHATQRLTLAEILKSLIDGVNNR